MIPMHPHLISQLIADRQADLMASARQQRLARQARAARRARPAQRGHAAPMLAALGRLAWRRSSPRTIQTPAAGPGQAAPALTPRELDLLKLVAQRLTNPDTAQQLVLSEHTVHRHLANISGRIKRHRGATQRWRLDSFYTAGFNAAPAPLTTYATCAIRRDERHGLLSTACAERASLRTLTAVIHTSTRRPESAISNASQPSAWLRPIAHRDMT